MADVRVKAKRRGQKPDGTWAEEGDEFTVPEKLVSDRWMIRLSKAPTAKKAEGQ